MARKLIFWLSLLPAVFCECGSTDTRIFSSAPTPSIRIAPTSAFAGSSTVELTVTGQGFAAQGLCGTCINSVVVWRTNTGSSRLPTTLVSSTVLSASIPADLLTSSATAEVTVEDWVEGAESPRSVTKPAEFSIKDIPAGAPIISAISPASSRAGSTDVTVTITGSRFTNISFLNSSVAFWTTDPNNLHDHGTMLSTSFVSSTQLSVVIPAALLANSTTAQIVVLNGDSMGMSDGFFGYPESNSVTFTVTQ